MILRNESGIALIMVLFTVALLAAITVHFGSTINWQLQAAVNQSDGVRLEAAMRSALNLFRAALYADGLENEGDSYHDDWATIDSEKMSGLTGSDNIRVSIRDLSGLLQVNALVSDDENLEKRRQFEQQQRTIWLRFLNSGRFAVESENEAAAIIDAISDWIDTDDDERDKGAESGYYRSQEPPYKSSNNYLTHPEELLLIKGVSVKLLYGDEEHPGIIDFVTVQNNDGKINLSTTPLEILQVLSTEITEEIARDLITFREDEENKDFLKRPDWYKEVAGFPDDIVLDDAMLTQFSRNFAFNALIEHSGYLVKASGILHRNEKNEQTLLYWKVE